LFHSQFLVFYFTKLFVVLLCFDISMKQ
jgi:hypothetical protein